MESDMKYLVSIVIVIFSVGCADQKFLKVAKEKCVKGSVTLAWDPVESPELFGYRLQHGPESGIYDQSVDVGNVTTYKVEGLSQGYHYFIVRSLNAELAESVPSNEVSTFCN